MTDDSDKIKQAENDKKFAQERENRLKKYVNNSDEEDDDQNFIKKDEPQVGLQADLQEVIADFKENQNLIKPKNNQQRNLDRETGGLEEDEDKKEESEKDVWDDRSEEVDKMGSTDTFNTTSMKSVVWKQKQNRLKAKKLHEAGADSATVSAVKNGKVKSGSSFDDMGYVQRLKNLKQDHSHENNGGRGI